MHDWTGFPGMGGYGFGWVLMLLFWIAVIAGILALSNWFFAGFSRPKKDGPSRSARDILDERFARGEIGHEEYEQRKRTLDE